MAFNLSVTPAEQSIINKMFIKSHLVFVSFNMAKMQANGFTMTMAPAVEAIYGDDAEAKKEAYLRHQNFFNTHAVPFNFIAGLAYAMEKDQKEGKVTGDTINSIKVSLMGPTAGMFDALFFNTLRVIAAGIAIGLMSQGNALGIPIFILLYGVSQSVLKYYLLKIGYVFGTSFIDTVFSSGLMSAMTKASAILGLTMVGAITATTVHVPLTGRINIGGAETVLGDVINSIFPGILSIALVLILMRLIKKRGWRPVHLVFLVFGLGMLGALIGLFG